MLREEEEETPLLRAAPLKELVVKAAAVEARIEAIASFIVGLIRYDSKVVVTKATRSSFPTHKKDLTEEPRFLLT